MTQLQRHDRRTVVNLFTHEENQQVHQAGNPPSSSTKHLLFAVPDPNAQQANDNEICIWVATDASLTINKLSITLNAAANEVAGDLKYADAFIGLGTPVLIYPFDTTLGVLAATGIGVTVPVGKCIYLSFDSPPHEDIKSMNGDIEFTYD